MYVCSRAAGLRDEGNTHQANHRCTCNTLHITSGISVASLYLCRDLLDLIILKLVGLYCGFEFNDNILMFKILIKQLPYTYIIVNGKYAGTQ